MLRSSPWFDGDDEVALAHRAAIRASGGIIERGADRPIIAVIDTSSDANPCNLPLRELSEHVRVAVTEAGGTALVMPAMSLGEDLMKPSAMLYRNLLSIEVEELLRANPIDGVVLLTNCDKTTPGSLMGAVSMDLPTILLVGGNREAPVYKGAEIATGAELWRELDRYRRGESSAEEWREFEAAYGSGLGSCHIAGTASSMAMVVEALGFSLPGASTVQVADGSAVRFARDSGARIVEMVRENLRPSTILTEESFRNAARVLQAVGGSSNAVIHLTAIAGRAGIEFGPDKIAAVGANVPVIADVQPCGRQLMRALDAAGGVPAILRRLDDVIEGDALTCTGASIRSSSAGAPLDDRDGATIRRVDDPVVSGQAIRALRGTLAPRFAVIKSAASDPRLWKHRGPALVFHGYEEMRERIEDPDLEVTADHVLVLSGCGPVGVPGMPEWGMIPIPRKLLDQGVTDMVRITDSRMSGTSFGTVILHVSPEGAVGGPIALVRDGDMISVDIEGGRVDLELSDEEWERRRAAWTAPVSPHLRGWPMLYQKHVLQADQGADLDFLTAPTPAHRIPVEPVIGRS